MADLEIDYSGIATPAVQTAQEEWEPPIHKYYGKKLANGKTEKEPIYTYQEFPRMMYALRDGKIHARVVNSEAEKSALGDKWATNPSAFGYFTAPSFEQVLAAREAKIVPVQRTVADIVRFGESPEQATADQEAAQVVRRDPGRTPKA